MMIPSYRYSHHHPMPFDLNQEHHHFTTTTNPQLSSSSLSSYSYWDQQQPNHLQLTTHQQGEKIHVPSSGGSWDHIHDYRKEEEEEEEKEGNKKSSKLLKLKILKKEDRNENHDLDNQAHHDEEDHGSVKWMSSKMRIMGGSDTNNNFRLGFDEEGPKQQPPLSPLGTDISSSNSNNNNSSSNHHDDNNHNMIVRVCSDCHTTKTPLWRSGPRGPKSLCNACGIRQRKARRAAAAAAAADVAASKNDTTLMASTDDDGSHHGMKKKKEKKLQKNNNKDKKLKAKCSAPNQLKKKHKIGTNNNNNSNTSSHRGRKKVGFEDLRISLSKNLALNVFPHDEKEAAILLMALSYGLLHGFPSDVT